MADVPLNAKVECADGPCGESVTVVVNPTTQTVTYLVVQDKTIPGPAQRLVPVDQVERTTSDLIRLRCTKDQLAGMEPFIETHYVQSDQPVVYPAYPSYDLPYVAPSETVTIPVEVERVPPGELAVHRGTRVEAKDGYVGKVDLLLVDPKSGHITHLVLQEGHLWGKKEVTLSISAIDFVHKDTVYLKLDKQAIEQLPTIPIKRRHIGYETEVELFVKVFDDPDKASESLEFVEDLHRRKIIRIHNAAVLVKDDEGNVSLKDTRDIDPKKGRLLGAITGGVIGLVGGPVGAVVGALAGAGAGSLAGKWIDLGFSDKFLTGLQERLQPGRSALIVLVEHEWAVKLADSLADEEGVILQQVLTDGLVEQLVAEGKSGE